MQPLNVISLKTVLHNTEYIENLRKWRMEYFVFRFEKIVRRAIMHGLIAFRFRGFLRPPTHTALFAQFAIPLLNRIFPSNGTFRA